MKLRIKFGWHGYEYEMGWFRDLADFPRVFTHNALPFEWASHTPDPTGKADHILMFTRVYGQGSYGAANTNPPDFEEHFKFVLKAKFCECGANHTSFPQFHMQFCPEYAKIKEVKKIPDDQW